MAAVEQEQPEELKIKIEGVEYPFPSFDTLSFREARTIKRQYAIVLGQFFTALEDGDPDALLAIAYIAKRRDNPAFRPEDLEELTLDQIEIITPEPVKEDTASPLDVPPSESDEPSSKGSPSDGSGSSPS